MAVAVSAEFLRQQREREAAEVAERNRLWLLRTDISQGRHPTMSGQGLPPSVLGRWAKVAHRFPLLDGVPGEADRTQNHILAVVQATLAREQAARADTKLSAEGKRSVLAAIRADAEAKLAELDDPRAGLGQGWARLREVRERSERTVEARLQPAPERLPLQAAHLTHLARLSRHQAVRELGLAAERARDPTLPEHERQAAVNLLQASRAAPGGMIGGGPLPEELTTQADRALRESLGGADFHRADDLAAESEHVRRLRENAAP